MNIGQHLVDRCYKLNVGEAFRIDRRTMEEAFGAGMFEGLIDGHEGPIDRILSRLMGSNYGAFRVEQDPIRGDVTISRHEPGKRVRHDPDRRHLPL